MQILYIHRTAVVQKLFCTDAFAHTHRDTCRKRDAFLYVQYQMNAAPQIERAVTDATSRGYRKQLSIYVLISLLRDRYAE